MLKNTIARGLVVSLFLVVGCESQTVKQNSIDEIVAAYEQAQADRQYATHLRPMLPEELASLPADQLMLRDFPGEREQTPVVESSHAMKEIDQAELEKLSQYFEMPVLPTHVMEFKTVSKEDKTTQTNVTPLYLVQNGEGWNVIVGVMKSQGEIEKSYQEERLTFNEDDGLWKQHWELQFDKGGDYDYEIVVQKSGTDTPEQVVLAKDEVKFPADRKVIRFHLMPEGAENVFEPRSTGGFSLPFAYQAGNRAMSAATELPLEAISLYEPNREPSFVDDAITLARFQSTSESGDAEYLLLLKRSPKE